jgi:NCS1 family nucleobase:cation symporter-1
VGVIVTSSTAIIYGQTEWDIVKVAGKFSNPWIVTFAMVGILISTLATNIAANIVSPANDFAHLAPQKINFRTGGYITGIIGVLIFPWKLIADPSGYIFTWLVAYSSLLGPVGGIMIADYYFIRKKELVAADLYRHAGVYGYGNGYNSIAIIALVLGVAPNVPGFLVQIGLMDGSVFPAWINKLYSYAWFVGFGVSAVLYYILMKRKQLQDAGGAIHSINIL